ncbi:MAG TPA: DUF4367 domain-containing protein [Anaerovoracaceae bacterium]|nr:DUF4367 domain-containing protein [Anaerovoracaceae bacterium]
MIDRNVSDRLFDMLFRQAVIDNYEQELSAIPSEKELSAVYSFSDAHIARMRRLFAQAERLEILQSAAKWTRRCAAVIIVGSVVLFGALMTVPEVRAAVKSVIIEWFDQFTKFTSGQDSTKESHEWEPSYVPKGFTEDERYGDFGRLTIWYLDSKGNTIVFTYIDQSDSASVDNENRDFYEVEAAGTIYYVFEAETSDKGNSVIWDKEGYRFTVGGQLPVSELLNIAESAEKNPGKF